MQDMREESAACVRDVRDAGTPAPDAREDAVQVRGAQEGDAAYVRDAQEDAVQVRDAQEGDVEQLLNIYDYYVRETAVSFDWETPSLDEFTDRMRRIKERYPYLVVVDQGVVAGYAYAQPFVGRTAYDWTCELTIYLDAQARHRGLGRTLYDALEQRLSAMGILDLYACIGVPHREDSNPSCVGYPPTSKDPHLSWDSPRFHEHLGFHEVGHFEKCGYKFGRWYDMIWMGKAIGAHRDVQPPVMWYPQLKSRGIF